MPDQIAHKAAFKPANTMIRVGTVMGIPQALESLGLDSGEVLAEGGFDPGIFSDPDNLLVCSGLCLGGCHGFR
jgi:hypothetical protein